MRPYLVVYQVYEAVPMCPPLIEIRENFSIFTYNYWIDRYDYMNFQKLKEFNII
jgi:hypothetical protein